MGGLNAVAVLNGRGLDEEEGKHGKEDDTGIAEHRLADVYDEMRGLAVRGGVRRLVV